MRYRRYYFVSVQLDLRTLAGQQFALPPHIGLNLPMQIPLRLLHCSSYTRIHVIQDSEHVLIVGQATTACTLACLALVITTVTHIYTRSVAMLTCGIEEVEQGTAHHT